MRLDHLLSRDLGACEGAGARTGAPPGSSRGPSGGPDGRTAREHAPWPVSAGARVRVLVGAGGGCLPSFCCFLRVCVGCGGGGGWGHAVGVWGCVPFCVLLLLPPCCGGLWGCGWVGCELYSGREYLCSLWCVFVVCLASWSCCVVRGGVWGVVSACVVCCFYGRSVDALAPGADEGRGGLR